MTDDVFLSDQAAAEVVYGLYRVMLNRPPDRAGLEAYTRQLTVPPLAQSFEHVLRSMMRSEEMRGHRSATLLGTALPELVANRAPALRRHKVLSLGTHCYTSWLLQHAGLRHESGPFDWLFSSVGMVRHCLDDDFRTLLDPRWFHPVPVEVRKFAEANKCHHTLYRERFGVDHVFNHRDPTIPDDLRYLERCVARFRQAAQSAEPVFLLCTLRPAPHMEAETSRLVESVARYFRFGFLIVVSVTEGSSAIPTVCRLSIDGPGQIIAYTSTSKWLDLCFDSFLDDICLLTSFVDAAFQRIQA